MSESVLIQLDIKLFGAFRTCQNAPVTLHMPAGATAATVKTALSEALQQCNAGMTQDTLSSLIASSALATAQAVLTDSDTLNHSQSLAILPPVCGG